MKLKVLLMGLCLAFTTNAFARQIQYMCTQTDKRTEAKVGNVVTVTSLGEMSTLAYNDVLDSTPWKKGEVSVPTKSIAFMFQSKESAVTKPLDLENQSINYNDHSNLHQIVYIQFITTEDDGFRILFMDGSYDFSLILTNCVRK